MEKMSLNRRRFLAGGVALAAGPAFSAPAGRGGKMRFGFTTYQWGMRWDIPTLIANCTKAKAFGVELRTSANYAHGVETTLDAAARREVKKRFADSPVELLGVASSERFCWPDPERLKTAIESAKAQVVLSRDVGGKGVRVVPNDFHKGVPQEKTIEQISRTLNIVGRFAAEHGQMIRLENHGSAGTLPTLRKIMEGVDQKNVRIKLNGEGRDAADFAQRFQMVREYLGDTLHFHELDRGDFPYQLQSDLLADSGWDGWWLLETSTKVEDPFQALLNQRALWERIIEKTLSRKAG